MQEHLISSNDLYHNMRNTYETVILVKVFITDVLDTFASSDVHYTYVRIYMQYIQGFDVSCKTQNKAALIVSRDVLM